MLMDTVSACGGPKTVSDPMMLGSPTVVSSSDTDVGN